MGGVEAEVLDADRNPGAGTEWLVGVDVGGTFTDGVLIRPGEEAVYAKAPTSDADSVDGMVDCLERLGAAVGCSADELLSRCGKLAYGTTKATNMLVEGKLVKTGFLTTAGFRDTLIIAGVGRDRIGQDLVNERPRPLIPRRLILEVSERVSAAGAEITPLSMEDVDRAADFFETEAVEAIGICLLWSFKDSGHEQAAADRLRKKADWVVVTSSDCAPVLGEYQRSATTALNAGLGPPIDSHLRRAGVALANGGLTSRPLAMTSFGGLVSFKDATAEPISLVGSGPAGGVLACKRVAEAMGLGNVICADMGGTTFDVSVITGGEPRRLETTTYAGQEVAAAAIEVVSIGAGGGSIAWIDDGPRLKIGPRSAGANPGPACYGWGGSEPTITDADCALGRLAAESPDGSGGRGFFVDADLAEEAIGQLAPELGWDLHTAADGIDKVANAMMAGAIHSQTISRGIDVREYSIFAYGGGGPVHAAGIASDLGVKKVVVPALAPVLSAYGVVASRLEHRREKSVPVPVEAVDVLGQEFEALLSKASRDLELDKVPPSSRVYIGSATLRFKGQLHSLEVTIPGDRFDQRLATYLTEQFVNEYEGRYGKGTGSIEAGVEVVTLAVRAIGQIAVPPLEGRETPRRRAEESETRTAWIDGTPSEVPVYRGRRVPGNTMLGPAIVHQVGSSTWLPPGAEGHIDEFGSLVICLT